MSQALRVLLVGATGLVGSACLQRLIGQPRVVRITCLTRRELDVVVPSRVHIVPIDFEQLDAVAEREFQVDAVICALGSTIRQAGSQASFRRVDHDYVLHVAQRAQAAGVERFGLVSALGADARSRVFYNRVKGEIEAAVTALDFPTLVIVRPSLLIGKRREFRLVERLTAPFGRLLPARWRAVPAVDVAAALVDATLMPAHGSGVIENADLLGAAR
jgi:uncharacterized protein YbjT (DUF2867 family)